MIGFDILTIGGLGKTRFSATTASALAVGFYWMIEKTFPTSLTLHVSLFFLITFISMVQLNQKKAYALSDPKEVVIDEFLGMYIALILGMTNNLFYIFLLFVIFRVLDILKPFPISWIERKLNNQYGLLFDDIIIGMFLGTICSLLMMYR